MAADGTALATYEFGDDPDARPVMAVHGFSSSATANWVATGWTRDLVRAGFRVIAYDQRGHGASGKPHEPGAYSMELLVGNAEAVIDAYLLDEVGFLGYSLGARVGWHTALAVPQHVERAVLGGIPDGDPLTRFQLERAHRYLETGEPVDDRLTQAYLTMAEANPANDLVALLALVEGMRGGAQPDPADPPAQPLLFATGTGDPIIERSRTLAAATPNGEFFAIPERNHFNAPTSKAFRERAIAFLAAGS